MQRKPQAHRTLMLWPFTAHGCWPPAWSRHRLGPKAALPPAVGPQISCIGESPFLICNLGLVGEFGELVYACTKCLTQSRCLRRVSCYYCYQSGENYGCAFTTAEDGPGTWIPTSGTGRPSTGRRNSLLKVSRRVRGRALVSLH